MAHLPQPPRNQISYVDADRDQQPEVLRDDHYDHDLKFVRTNYEELAPKKEELILLPRWMVLSLYFLVILVIIGFAIKAFKFDFVSGG